MGGQLYAKSGKSVGLRLKQNLYMTTCLNCEKEFKGKFCPKCGQKAKTGRITLAAVFQELRQHVIHFDQGFIYTIKQLIIRPGHSIREYLEGKRVRHIKPLKFLFWAAAISFLVFHYVGLDEQMLQQFSKQPDAKTPDSQKLSQKLMLLVTGHPTVVVYCMIPMIALFSWWLFRRRPYNFAEHFVLNAYLLGELSLMSVITSPLARFFSNMNSSAWVTTAPSLVIWAVYFGWAYGQFLQSNSIWVRVKGVLAILLGYLLLIICVALFTALVIVLFRPQLEAWMQH